MPNPKDHKNGIRDLILTAKDGEDLNRAFDSILALYLTSDEVTATIDICNEVLSRADELQLSADDWLRISMHLIESLRRKGAIHEASTLSNDVLSRVRSSNASQKTKAEALCRLSMLASSAGDLAYASDRLAEARLHVESANDLSTFGYFHHAQGRTFLLKRDFASAVSSFEASGSVYRLFQDKVNEAIALGQLARCHMLTGHIQLARACFDRALGTDDLPRRVWVTQAINCSICLMYSGEYSKAISFLDQAVVDSIRIGLPASVARANITKALISLRQGLEEQAATLTSQALEIVQTNGLLREELAALECLGEIEYERGNPAEAIKIYEQCIAKGEAVGMSDATTEGKRREAEAWNALGEHDKALAAALRAIEVAETNEDRYEHAVAHRPLGVAHSMLGEKEAAEKALRQGIDEIRAVGDPLELAKTLIELARHLREWDPSTLELGAAGEHLREARQLLEKLGVEKWIRRVDDDIREVIRLTESTAEATPAVREGGAVRTGARPAVERGIKSVRTVTIITRAPELREIMERIARVAPSNLPVLITGESGTGKELFARALQELSGRPPDRFVAVNCAALPRELHESELFGHARGSFTGSTSEKPGLFETADGGTIFLDEIGDLDPGAQGKLLRVLENGEVRRVGELKPRRIDARVVAATNRDLVQGSREETFRGDLFHRLNGLQVGVPSLRERPGDIDPLVHHFLDIYQTQYKKRVTLPVELLELYRSYRWPGNVRELRQEIHRMVLLTADGTTARMADSEVPRLAAGDEVTALAESSGLASAVGEHERRLILDAMLRSAGNKAKAARLLNMSRTTLIGKIKRLGIE